MKNPTFKAIATVLLFAITLSLPLLNGCQKNVRDVYDYAPVVLAPDFELTTVNYAFDNEALNSASTLSFKVDYKNNEATKTTYSTVLNFYVDGLIQQSIQVENLKSNTNYESIFDWKAVAGKHDFKFEINLSSAGVKIIDEGNITNNMQTTSFDIAVKNITVVKEVPVTTAAVTQSMNADTQSNVVGELAKEGIVISSKVEAVKTTYNDNTTAIVAAVENTDGTIDPTKVVFSITNNAGVTQGQAKEATTTVIVQTLVAEKEISFYNGQEKLTYRDGVVSFTGLKSARAFDPCTEPSNLQSLDANTEAKLAWQKKIDDAIAQYGLEKGLGMGPLSLIEILTGYELTQGGVDNSPTYTVEIVNSSIACPEECIGGFKVNPLSYPGFILRFSDDRNPGVVLDGTTEVISSYTKTASCGASNDGTYTFKDCGGNAVTFIFNGPRPVIVTDAPCVADVHNGL